MGRVTKRAAGANGATRANRIGPVPQLVTIDHLGADADGIATLPDGTTLYVPFTLPGEAALVEPGGKRGQGRVGVLEAVEQAAPERVAPVCRHFGSCGGCVLQHGSDAFVGAWKTGLLADALRRAGFEGCAPAPIQVTPLGSRRRADLAIHRMGRRVLLGLHVGRGKDIVDLQACPVLAPGIAALIGPLRDCLTGLGVPRREGSAIVNLMDNGADVLLRLDADPGAADRAALIAFAQAHDVPRISVARGAGVSEPVAIFRAPVVALSGAKVAPAPGAFLQASREGEAAIVAAVLAGLPEKLTARARVVELFAGCGTLSFALAGRARVVAYEGDGTAVAALRQAANQAGLANRISVAQRDLARQPLQVAELKDAAAVVLDPPFAGAPVQMAAIAAARPGRVIHVGCNPAALARDLRPLREAGYRVMAATPVDQFRYSARLESVTVLARD